MSVPTRKTAGQWGYADQVADACPNATDPNHRTGPSGYNARADWADQMIKTHAQSQCPRCDLWVIWTPKPRAVGKMGLSGNLHVDNRHALDCSCLGCKPAKAVAK